MCLNSVMQLFKSNRQPHYSAVVLLRLQSKTNNQSSVGKMKVKATHTRAHTLPLNRKLNCNCVKTKIIFTLICRVIQQPKKLNSLATVPHSSKVIKGDL